MEHVGDCADYSTVSDNILELRKRTLKDKEKTKSSNYVQLIDSWKFNYLYILFLNFYLDYLY